MGASRGPRVDRAFLRVEHLEDRTTPSFPSYSPNLPLDGQITSGAIAGDRVTVLLVPGASPAALKTAPYTASVKSLGFDIYSVHLKAGTDLTSAIANLSKVPGVTTAEPDRIVHATAVPNDPFYALQYGPALIGAETAWNITTGNPNFVVAVIDSGIDYTHPDLAANIWTNPGTNPAADAQYPGDLHGWNFAYGTNDPFDDNGHGTHVSGILGAVGNNGIGVAGVNWSVQIMPLKFLDSTGAGFTSDAIAAIDFAVSHGARVLNNSWGGGAGSTFDPALGRAIGRTQSAGDIFVVAAGNDGVNNDTAGEYPGNYSLNFNNVITVAATDNTDTLASFSDFGPTTVTLAAPGVNIYSTQPGDSYQFLDGTSMATPYVAGALALYWGANPNLTYTQVINKLLSSVDKIPSLDGLVSTGGRLDVAKMFNASPVPPIVVGAPPGTEQVRVLGVGGATQQVMDPYPGFHGGVVAVSGDVNGDGVPDLVTAASFGGHVKVFDGATGTLLRSFFAFPGYNGHISLAVGNLDGDGVGDIVVAADVNGHVKVFDGPTGVLLDSFFAYPGYNGHVELSVADTDGSGRNELITAADGGAGVHVKVMAPDTMALLESFFATERDQWPGFSISAYDLNFSGFAELIVSQGPRVRVLDIQTQAVRADFLAFDPLSNDRVTVQAAHYNAGPSAQVVAIHQTQGRSEVRVFQGLDFTLADSWFADTR